MTASKRAEFLSLLDKIKDLRILVAGDIILDRYVWGRVDRISPEAPVPVVEVHKIEDRLGGAGNVVGNLVGLGAKVSLCGFVGNDSEGEIVVSQLKSSNVNCDGIVNDEFRPTALKTRVIAHKQQVVRIDREDRGAPSETLSVRLASAIDSGLDSCNAVIISDYGKGTFSSAIMDKLAAAKVAGRISLSKRPLVVDPHPSNNSLYRGISVVKPNRREAEQATGIQITDRESAVLAARALVKKWGAEIAVVTLGEDGMVLFESGATDALTLETRALDVFDVSGAGDTVTAVLTASLAAGATLLQAGELANIAAGIVVAEVGTVAVTHEMLVHELKANY
ncbi:MAG: bifunctional hydroxymethylpyrimidine kinase/phosphomethylpyrimidine kinase [Bdellovibrionales bacterium]|nr:bifunctional hydroxymethylpyrimidine kinase/phosphomethylpyrimidine kinase [Bdellovibrionales bacterium]